VEEPYASQRELDILRAELHRLDDHGSRGIGSIQTQLTDLVKDVTELKTEVNSRFDSHQRVHDQDKIDRINGRRWLIATIIGAAASIAGLYFMMVQVLQSIHH
jgi:hypothetical protein